MFEKQNHIILSLTFVLLAFCLQSKAQTDTTGPLITAEFKNIPVETFLLDIESRTGFHFYYKTADFESL
ncbi:MAG: hypothetical protein Q8R50_11350 [Sediminibacterium sp.]|nr:hypothetical protein [Sediminibacterium sp.]